MMILFIFSYLTLVHIDMLRKPNYCCVDVGWWVHGNLILPFCILLLSQYF
jgi:hypothetical protein